MPKICIDPGHNAFGVDTGAEGCGLKEQDLTLDIGLRLKNLLIQNGFDVVMTREGATVGGTLRSVTDSLLVRCNIANQAKADLFVAIHINAGGGTGSEIWVSGRGGNAERAANAVLARLISACGWANRGVKTANDYVLRYTDMPAILTENGFIDTPSDAAKLADPNFRQAIAEAHAKGICDYFGMEFKEEGGKGFMNLILVGRGPDERAAGYLADYLQAPVAYLDSVKQSDLDTAQNVYVVGGNKKPVDRAILLSGSDRFGTCQAVLDFIAKGGR